MIYWRAVHRTGVQHPTGPAAEGLDRSLDPLAPDFPSLGGNAMRLLVSGDEAYPEMLAAIERARHHIHLQTFILGADMVGRTFLERILERAQAGVQCRVMYDRFGSTPAVWSGFFRRYRRRSANLKLVGWTQANPLRRHVQINLRNHRKILVVDGEEAFFGGVNIATVNVSTPGAPAIRDYHFHVRGPLVHELQYTFLRDWHFMAREAPERLLCPEHFPEVMPIGKAEGRVLNGGPAGEYENLLDLYVNAVNSARDRLYAVTPYFVPPSELLRALRSAALRGVDVRLVVPWRNNHFYAGLAGRAFYEDLLDAGARIFERLPPFIHAKAMVVDDWAAIVGTANLDARSLRLNYETNAVVYDEPFVAEMTRAIQTEAAHAIELDPFRWRNRSPAQRLAENFCALLSPVL